MQCGHCRAGMLCGLMPAAWQSVSLSGVINATKLLFFLVISTTLPNIKPHRVAFLWETRIWLVAHVCISLSGFCIIVVPVSWHGFGVVA